MTDASHPSGEVKFIDGLFELPSRIRHKLEVKWDERQRTPGRYEASPDPDRDLHLLLGAPWPCPETEGFQQEWSHVIAEIEGGGPLGQGHDVSVALARTQWCIVRHLRPRKIIETGVARGISSRFLLAALDLNGSGRLWSIDLPPLRRPWRDQVGAAVPNNLRTRWTYLRGASRTLLPELIRELGEIDLFIHDSLHIGKNMMFEFGQAWTALRPGGILLSDDIGGNSAFEAVTGWAAAGDHLVVEQAEKKDVLGVARKPEPLLGSNIT